MKINLSNVISKVSLFLAKETENFSKIINEIEQKVQTQIIKKEEKGGAQIQDKLYFSTCYRDKNEMNRSKIEQIISQLNIITQDKHISLSELAHIKAHSDILDDEGIFLIIDEFSGVVAVPNKFHSGGIEFEKSCFA